MRIGRVGNKNFIKNVIPGPAERLRQTSKSSSNPVPEQRTKTCRTAKFRRRNRELLVVRVVDQDALGIAFRVVALAAP